MRFRGRYAGAILVSLMASGSVFAAAPAQAAVAGTATKHTLAAPRVTATPGDRSVRVSWTSAGSTTSYYRVFRSTSPSVSTTSRPVKDKISHTLRSWTNTGLTNGTYYYYRVQAVSGSVKKTSSTVHTRPVAPAPIAPSGVTATASNTSVTLTWIPGVHTTGFKVYRSSSSTVSVKGAALSGTLSATTKTFKDTTVSAASAYSYVIVATGAGGTAASKTVHVTTLGVPAVPPGVPTGVVATASGTTVVLTWTPGSATAGFKVYRSTSTPVATTGTPVSGDPALDASTTSFTDTSVLATTDYFYVVVAIGNPTTTAPAVAVTSDAASVTTKSGQAALSVLPAFTSTVDQPVSDVVTVMNKGKGRLTISSVAITGTTAAKAQFVLGETGSFTIEPGASRDLALTFTPVNIGKVSVNVVITSDDPVRPSLGGTIKGLGTVGNFGALRPEASDWSTLTGQALSPLLGADLTDLRLVFNRLGFGDHDDKTTELHTKPTATVALTNGGVDPVTINSLETTGSLNGDPDWTITDAPALPVVIAPGGSVNVTLTFVYCRALTCNITTHPAAGVVYGTLVVGSDDPGHETSTILLAGGWQVADGGSNELTLAQWINGVLGITTTLFGPGQSINYGNGAVVAAGDEVLSTSWAAVDPLQPVYVRQIVATHGAGGDEPFYWYTGHTKDNKKKILQQATTDWQTVLPGGLTGPNAEGSFLPGSTVFELQVAQEDYSDDALNDATSDNRHGCVGACGHHVRFYPVKNGSGDVVPGLYLMAVDSNGGNFDYQDEDYLISNVMPAVG
jgi:Fibronectin type III domain